ncbi:protein TANC2-like [Pecten maximus]|uniref:protein TANC2-like n=1 Tax=Pecten maximus TaxID=6579 RepID=UPI0014587D37|nr:protein TANC2-like [Pecten maximus]
MDSLHQQIRDIDFSNWLDVAVAISVTTKGISEYLEGTFLALHHDIKYGACAQLPICGRNCSKTQRKFSTWCPTCIKWKEQIMLYNKYRARKRHIKWEEINSSDLPKNVDEMVKAFAPEWWRVRTPFTEDLSVGLHVLHNCTKFNIPVLTCQRVRDVRNALFAHGHLQVSNTKKKAALRNLISFLNLPEISRTGSGKLAISQLKRLKSRCVLDLITEDDNIKNHLVLALNPHDDAQRDILDRNENIQEMRLCVRDEENNDGYRKYLLASLIVCILILVIGWVVNIRWNDTTRKGLSDEKECLTMTFAKPCPFESDFTFDGYLQDRRPLFGREWLIDKIQTSLIGTPSRGILLTAKMGYGKSTLVSHILCTSKLSSKSGIQNYILSYHICKFDVISTQKPDYFIKNLAGMLISKLPEAGFAILTSRLAMAFLQTSKCAEDPVGCIDAAVIHPLRGLTFDEERYVVIDAIDECGVSAAIDISILDVLSKRIGKMPWWLKFFITARNINAVTRKLPEMTILQEEPGNVQNQNDITAYLEEILFIHKPVMSRLFGIHADKKVVTKHILNISRSNFLYVDLAVKFWIDSPHSKVTDIPQSLSELYAYNLDRVFGDKEHLYDVARNVFEVLCTSYIRLQLDELEAILNVTNHPYDLRDLLRNQISNFVEHKTYISIYHKAICDYLTSNSSGYHKYYISTHNGHKLFANYLLSKHNNSMTDILSLFIHTAESSDSDLLHSFQRSKHFLKNMYTAHHLHLMAKTRNSFRGTKLLIRAIGSQHINSLTSTNVTASFLAAAFGNSETLKALIEEGGNYSFRVQNHPNKGGWEDVVNVCKYKALWGYGLLDIAAQNGRTDVVNVLLSKNHSLLYFKNGLGVNAVHLAAEHGHADILKRFLEINTSLADQHSLYLAAKNGHLRSVLLLLNHSVKDVCVKCEDRIHWIANITKRMQWHPYSNISDIFSFDLSDPNQYEELENVTFVLNDDTRLIECLTALEVAVQGGYTEIVSYLLAQTTNALHCREYGGRTPLLTAVRYNRSEILDLILDKGGSFTDKCEHLYNVTNRHSLRLFNINEKTALDNGMCQLGTTIEHLIAMNGEKEIAENLRSQGIYLNWTVQDESGNTPLHYAACNNEWEMIQYIISAGDSNVFLSAKNGSLPIHSAVLCNALMSYAALYPPSLCCCE